MISDSEHSADESASEKANSSAKMGSDSENSENAGTHEGSSRHHNGSCSDEDQLATEKEKRRADSSISEISGTASDNDSDCETNKNSKSDARQKSKTKEKNDEEEEEEEEEIALVSSENQKNGARPPEDGNAKQLNSKCDTPSPKVTMVPMSQLWNTATKKANEDEKRSKSKNDSVFSISSEDSDSGKPSTSRNRAIKDKISSIVTEMVSSDSDDDAPLQSMRTSKLKNKKLGAVRPQRTAAAKKAVVDLSGSESVSSSDGDLTPNYQVERQIEMPQCDLKSFHGAKVRLTQMNLPKLLEKHQLSEIRNQRQQILIRRKSNGETEICEEPIESKDDKESKHKSNKKSEDGKKKKKQEKGASDDESEQKKSDSSNETSDAKTTKKSKKTRGRPKRGVILSSDDDYEMADQKAPSSDEESDKVRKSKRKKGRVSDSDDFKPKGAKSDSDSADFKPKRRRIIGRSKKRDSSASDSGDSRKAKKGRRKRIKRVSENSSSNDEAKDKSSPAKGRKNIKKIIKVRDLDEETRLAAKEEQQRKKRIEERQKLYNSSFKSTLEDDGACHQLVLDFDIETKEPLISVDEKLVKKLKPHQAEGIKFMWDACFESVEKINEEDSKGGGCILAHCMGLGKTLQVVALTHTLLSHSDETKVERVLVICPVSTVLNWVNEFNIWLKHCKKNKDIEIFELTKCKKDYERAWRVNDWYKDGGVLIIGYDMFRNLSSATAKRGRGGKKMVQKYLNGLIDPGPDLVICDEGHLLKNDKTALSKAVTRIRTLRRIALTGTPLQNNLNEYYCMVQFVKPNLLGKYNEYLNRFVNPITNGQYHDSSPFDIQMMKRRSHILHKLLDGCVQRRDYAVLAPFLPPKHEYVLSIRLTPLQKQLYKFYIENRPQHDNEEGKTRSTRVFQDFQNLQRIWTHPLALRYNSNRFEEAEQKRRDALSDDDEGSLKDFIDDDDDEDDESNTPNSSGSDEDAAPVQPAATRRTRAMRAANNEPEPEIEAVAEKPVNPTEWWMSMCPEDELGNLEHSGKLQVFFSILKECEAIGDKVLVFSQSLYSLDVIEQFLSLIDDNTQNPHPDAKLCDYTGSWSQGLDYFRLDGSTPIDVRNTDCKSFNSEHNPRARLYLISTRAGGLGINLVAANRVIIFDVSWNPSHDIQSIFRVYRFGQTKPCYIYRFLAMGTMEEKIYERQVTKLAISKRVIDEQQIDRHYKAKDLNELYMTNLDMDDERPQPSLPKDLLFAEQIRKFDKLIYRYHEQDSLLENKEEETLSKEEIEAAWAEYEQEKTRKPVVQQNYAPQQQLRAAPGSSIYGIPTEIMLQLLAIVYQNGHPGATINTINQNVPGLLKYLYDSMGKGDRSFFDVLVTLYNNLFPDAPLNLTLVYNPQTGLMVNGMPNQGGMVNGGMTNQGMPNQGMQNQRMPNQGMMNGGMAHTSQNYVGNAPAPGFVQQPAPSTSNLNASGVIEID